MLFAGGDHSLCNGSPVERPGATFCDQPECAGQLGLLQHIARLPGLAVVEKDRGDVGMFGKVLDTGVEDVHVALLQNIAPLRQHNGRRHHLFEAHRSVLPECAVEAQHRAGHAHGEIGLGAAPGNHVALRVLEHRGRGGERCLFTEVEEHVLAAGQVDHHEAAAADVAAARLDHRQGIADRHRCIDGIAALLENLQADLGGIVLGGDHHCMFGRHRLCGQPRRVVASARRGIQRLAGDGRGLCRRGAGADQQCGNEQAAKRQRMPGTHEHSPQGTRLSCATCGAWAGGAGHRQFSAACIAPAAGRADWQTTGGRRRKTLPARRFRHRCRAGLP